MDALFADLRFAIRQIRYAPAFAVTAILTLALGIGANSALYTVADAILRKARPGVGESSSLVWVASTDQARSRPAGVSYQVAARVRAEVPLFERVSTIREIPLSLSAQGDPVKVKGQAVSGDYFAMLRASFFLGRGITPADDAEPGSGLVVVLNHRTWQSSFGADSAIVGRKILLNGLAFTVIGVTAPSFNGAEHDEETRAAWVPASMFATLLPEWRWMVTDERNSNIRVLARMRSERDRAQIEAGVQRVAASIVAADSARPRGWMLHTYRASNGIPAGGDRQILPLAALAFVVTGLVLLICCANIGNLMLARALARQREIAARLALGASRARVVRQLLTEALLLALVASGVGLLVAVWGTELLITTALPIPLDVSLDWRVFLVSAALALFAAVALGLAPALHATSGGVAGVLREAATGGTRRRTRLQGSLVVAQVAFSLLLLVLSGLFLRSLDKAQRVEVGFDASARVLALSYDVGLLRYDSTRALAFHREILARTRALPGVESVAITDLLPLTEWSSTSTTVRRADGQGQPMEGRASFSSISVDYFRTIGTPVMAGRDFAAADAPGAPLVAIVSEGFVRQYLGGSPGIGARVSLYGEKGPWHTVVGVARDAIIGSLAAPASPAVYLPLVQRPTSSIGASLLVRSSGANAATLGPSIREIVRTLDPALPVHRLTTLDRVRDAATTGQRAGASVLAVFGALALLLASIGLHGVMLFTVRQRTREIGIRMALGASASEVVRQFVRYGLRLAARGMAIGFVLALAGTQLARTFLFGVTPTDALTFVVVVSVFTAVALVACWLPARRASLVDPMTVMRAE